MVPVALAISAKTPIGASLATNPVIFDRTSPNSARGSIRTSLFLEPVTLGNYVIVVTIFVCAYFRRLSRVARPGSLVFLLSDFRGMDDEAATALSQLARHSDLVAVFLYDELERELPPAGRYRIQVADDAMTVDTSHDPTRAHYRDSFAQRQERMRELVKRLGISMEMNYRTFWPSRR